MPGVRVVAIAPLFEHLTTEMSGALIAAIEVATHPLAMPLVISNIEFPMANGRPISESQLH